jgi:hypothetical protein
MNNTQQKALDILNENEWVNIPYLQRKMKLSFEECKDLCLWLSTCMNVKSNEMKTRVELEIEDEIIINYIFNSASQVDDTRLDDPTVMALYDIVQFLNNRNPDWKKDRFCQIIFVWQANIFLDTHSDEVCEEKCPELKTLMLEYRKNQTIMGYPLPPNFGFDAFKYFFPKFKNENENVCETERSGCAPVRSVYFNIIEEGKDD